MGQCGDRLRRWRLSTLLACHENRSRTEGESQTKPDSIEQDDASPETRRKASYIHELNGSPQDSGEALRHDMMLEAIKVRHPHHEWRAVGLRPEFESPFG
jgi:hypothetical protein